MFVPENYVIGCAAVQQIADWLEKLGMSEYAACFAENKIDTAVLRYLSDQDLKDMGVPLGHRRKMLAAIAGIRPDLSTMILPLRPPQCLQLCRRPMQ